MFVRAQYSQHSNLGGNDDVVDGIGSRLQNDDGISGGGDDAGIIIQMFGAD